MISQGYFENIKTHLSEELLKAKHHIVVAVAWFTDIDLYDILLKKVQNGIIVEVMYYDDETNFQYAVNFTKLEKSGARVFKLGDKNNKIVMHNKFCIIDLTTVINGSYNWTKNAQTNHENITITWEAQDLAAQFIEEFKRLKNKYKKVDIIENEIDISSIIKRLEIIRNLILLKEADDIPLQILPLKKFRLSSDLEDIVQLLLSRNYTKALLLIEGFANHYKQISIYIDPEIAGLKLEAKSLEIQLKAISDEIEEIEKLLNNFSTMHTQQLGDLILKILEIRKAKAISEKELDEANNDYNKYNNEFKDRNNDKIFNLNKEDLILLKKAYRAASFMCHPDVTKDGEEWFKMLNEAYENNDLEKVQDILYKLKTGQPFETNSQKTNDKYLLQKLVMEMNKKIKEMIYAMEKMKTSPEYLAIIEIDNWDDYFEKMRKDLLGKLNDLQYEQ